MSTCPTCGHDPESALNSEPATDRPTADLAALDALRDEYPGVYYWEDPRWTGALGDVLRAASRPVGEEGLRAAQRLVDSGPQWSPHPDIADRVPVDVEWGRSLVAVADLRAALAAKPTPAPDSGPLTLYDKESVNVVGVFDGLTALVQFAFAYGQANPDAANIDLAVLARQLETKQ